MARARYTIISISRGPSEPAWHDEPERSTFTLTLSDSAGKRHVLNLAQPADRPIPAITGAVWQLDARLLCPEAEAKDKEKGA